MSKITVLTNKKSIMGRVLVNEFIRKKIPIDEIIFIEQDIKYYIKLFKFVCKRVGIFQT